MKLKEKNILIILVVLNLVTALILIGTLRNIFENDTFKIILVTVVLPLLNTIIMSILLKLITPKNKNDIEICNGGFTNIEDINWNHSNTLNIITLTLTLHYFPKEIVDNISKFKEINIILDHSKDETQFRNFVLGRELNDNSGYSETETALNRFAKFNKKEKNKINIYLTNHAQIPIGIMINNGKDIVYTPLWNHKNTSKDDRGAIGGVYLKTDIRNDFGSEIMESFKSILKTAKKIEDFNINEIREFYNTKNGA